MVSEEVERKRMTYWGIFLVLLFIFFILVREFWQKGGRMLSFLPLEVNAALAIITLVIIVIIVYYIHKAYAT